MTTQRRRARGPKGATQQPPRAKALELPKPEELAKAPPQTQAFVISLIKRAKTAQPKIIEVASDALVGKAAPYGDRAGRLLATSILHTYLTRKETGLHSYLAVDDARSAIHSIARSTPIIERNRRVRTWHKDYGEHGREARNFERLLGAVSLFATSFERRYIPDGEHTNRRAIGELYDLTDEMDHPLLHALPDIRRYDGKASQRDAAMHTNHLLRYMIAQASLETPAVPVEPPAAAEAA